MNDRATESAVLGVLLLVDSAYWRVAADLTPDMFSDGRHATIYRAIAEMQNDSRGVDILTLKNHLKAKQQLEQAGGIAYMSELSAQVAGDGNLEAYVGQIKGAYLKRSALRLIDQVKYMAQNPTYSGPDLLSHMDNFILEARKAVKQARETTIAEAVVSSIKEYEDRVRAAQNNEVSGITSGYANLDAITGGFKGGQLIILGGRPGMGKTAVAINLILNAAFTGVSCGMFSLEMTVQELVDRAMSNKANVESYKIQRGKIYEGEWERIMNEGQTALSKLPIVITDKPALSISEIRAMATNWKHRHNIGLIVVDYAQLVTTKGRSRNEEVGEVTRTLKQVAKELDLAVIALAQLGRKVEERADKIPILSDLRDSGEIEQDADKVLFLWRPEYYGISYIKKQMGEVMPDMTPTDGKICVIVEKNRQGARGEAWLDWHPEYQRVSPFTTPLIGGGSGSDGVDFHSDY